MSITKLQAQSKLNSLPYAVKADAIMALFVDVDSAGFTNTVSDADTYAEFTAWLDEHREFYSANGDWNEDESVTLEERTENMALVEKMSDAGEALYYSYHAGLLTQEEVPAHKATTPDEPELLPQATEKVQVKLRQLYKKFQKFEYVNKVFGIKKVKTITAQEGKSFLTGEPLYVAMCFGIVPFMLLDLLCKWVFGDATLFTSLLSAVVIFGTLYLASRFTVVELKTTKSVDSSDKLTFTKK